MTRPFTCKAITWSFARLAIASFYGAFMYTAYCLFLDINILAGCSWPQYTRNKTILYQSKMHIGIDHFTVCMILSWRWCQCAIYWTLFQECIIHNTQIQIVQTVSWKLFWDFGLLDLWSRTTYGPEPATPGPYGSEPLIIRKNIPSQICSRSIIWMHTAPGAYLLHAREAVCISDMIHEHIKLRIFFQIINGPEPYGPGAAARGPEVKAKISKKHAERLNLKKKKKLMSL